VVSFSTSAQSLTGNSLLQATKENIYEITVNFFFFLALPKFFFL